MFVFLAGFEKGPNAALTNHSTYQLRGMIMSIGSSGSSGYCSKRMQMTTTTIY